MEYKMSKSSAVNGNLIGILGGVILSTDSVFIRLMAVHNSWLIVVLRGLLMWAVVFAVWLLVPKSRAVLGVPWITRQNLLSVLFFCASSACFVNALNRGNVATVLVIISSTPFVSAIISRLFFATKIDKSLMVAAVVGMLGVVIVMSGRQPTTLLWQLPSVWRWRLSLPHASSRARWDCLRSAACWPRLLCLPLPVLAC
jgi:drug/metabolite transporter (DMT)-like permease